MPQLQGFSSRGLVKPKTGLVHDRDDSDVPATVPSDDEVVEEQKMEEPQLPLPIKKVKPKSTKKKAKKIVPKVRQPSPTISEKSLSDDDFNPEDLGEFAFFDDVIEAPKASKPKSRGVALHGMDNAEYTERKPRKSNVVSEPNPANDWFSEPLLDEKMEATWFQDNVHTRDANDNIGHQAASMDEKNPFDDGEEGTDPNLPYDDMDLLTQALTNLDNLGETRSQRRNRVQKAGRSVKVKAKSTKPKLKDLKVAPQTEVPAERMTPQSQSMSYVAAPQSQSMTYAVAAPAMQQVVMYDQFGRPMIVNTVAMYPSSQVYPQQSQLTWQ